VKKKDELEKQLRRKKKLSKRTQKLGSKQKKIRKKWTI